jgi:L-2-aminoadipate reductase
VNNILIDLDVTLLRRNLNEEPTLVSYYVPEMKRFEQWQQKQNKQNLLIINDDSMVERLKKFAALNEDIRQHLKAVSNLNNDIIINSGGIAKNNKSSC